MRIIPSKYPVATTHISGNNEQTLHSKHCCSQTVFSNPLRLTVEGRQSVFLNAPTEMSKDGRIMSEQSTHTQKPKNPKLLKSAAYVWKPALCTICRICKQIKMEQCFTYKISQCVSFPRKYKDDNFPGISLPLVFQSYHFDAIQTQLPHATDVILGGMGRKICEFYLFVYF